MGGSRRVPLPTTSVKAVAATYVYCVVRGAEQPAVASQVEALPGAGMPRVMALAANTWLVVANVPLKAFGEVALRKRMRDVDWVSRCGVAHQAVIDSFLGTDAVVPMTLFTIFANDERALAEARKDAARLEASLDRVAGRVEWVVRVLRGDAAAAAPTRHGGACGRRPRRRVRGASFCRPRWISVRRRGARPKRQAWR